MARTYKRLDDVFESGELIKFKKTGEVFIYHSSNGGANFSSGLTVALSNSEHYLGLTMLDDVVKVDIDGNVIDDFEQYKG